jgi:hypothetical protein
VRSRKQKADVGKYSFVNGTQQLWNQLSADALVTPINQVILGKS